MPIGRPFLGCVLSFALVGCGAFLALSDEDGPSQPSSNNNNNVNVDGATSGPVGADGSSPGDVDGGRRAVVCRGASVYRRRPTPEAFAGSINTPGDEELPRLTPSELTLYFYRRDLVSNEVAAFRSSRTSVSAPFGAPEAVPNPQRLAIRQMVPVDDAPSFLYYTVGISRYFIELMKLDGERLSVLLDPNTNASYSTPFVHVATNTLFVTRRDATGTHIQRTPIDPMTGAPPLGAPITPVLAAPEGMDTDPALSPDGLDLYFYSTRGVASGGRVWVASRGTTSDSFSAQPRRVQLIPAAAGYEAPGFISADGCRLYYYAAETPDGPADLYLAEAE